MTTLLAPAAQGWVLADPFRAHLRQLSAITGWPAEVLAVAAGVQPRLARHLVGGRDGRRVRRLCPDDAAALLALDAAEVTASAQLLVPVAATVRRLARLLVAGERVDDLAERCRLSRAELLAVPLQTSCRQATAWAIQAAASGLEWSDEVRARS